MADADDGGGRGMSPEEAFSLLANETRVTTLEALWEVWDDAVPFSELRRRVGVRDAGQFHYHLSKLRDHFVRKTEAGYELTPAGFKITQAVIAGTGIDTPTLETTPRDTVCHRCGSTVELRYSEGTTRMYCTNCSGFWSGTDEYGAIERGYLGGWEFPPAGLDDRSPGEILDASIVYMLTRTESLMAGVCPDCGGRAGSTIDICESHAPGDTVCDDCGQYFLGVIRWQCEACKLVFAAPSWAVAVLHPTVRLFLTAAGTDYRDDPWRAIYVGCEHDWQEEVVAEEPLRVRIRIEVEEESCEMLLDERGNIASVVH